MRASRSFRPCSRSMKCSTVAERLADHFGTEGSPISLNTACASGATRIQLGVEAIRRGECEAVLAVGADGSIDAGIAGALFAAVGAVDTERSARARIEAVLQEPRRLRDCGRRGGLGAGRHRPRPRARRPDSRHRRRLRRESRLVSSHAIEPRRQADRRLHAQCARRCGRRARRCRLHQRTWHLHAGKRQDGISRRLDGVRRSGQGTCRFRPTNR